MLLLALALVLNGLAPAALRHAPMASASHEMAPAQAQADMAMGHCHDAAMPSETAPDPGAPADCCDGGLCDCACTLGAATLFVATPWLGANAPATLATHRLATGHHAPALPDPIRPPIGQAA